MACTSSKAPMELDGLGTSQAQAACWTVKFFLPLLRPPPMQRCRWQLASANSVGTTSTPPRANVLSASGLVPPQFRLLRRLRLDEPPECPPMRPLMLPQVWPSFRMPMCPGLVPREPPLLQEALVHRPRADARRHNVAPEDAVGEPAHRPHAVARLLASLALGGLARRLARVCPAAGEVPTRAAAVGDPHHQDLAVPDDEARGGVRTAMAEAAGTTAGKVAVHPLAMVPGPRREHLLLLLGRTVGVFIHNVGPATSHREIAARLHEKMVGTRLQGGDRPARANTFMTSACHRVRASDGMQANKESQVTESARE
mmetsp:Transcript_6384/g.20532  ORF Transcript_6384/g.20532 Transcript_6384/m.20532 type:complete len:313 (-) Transcript_6384:70-1008(-)